MSRCWETLRRYTEARIGQDRMGHAVTTTEVLKFQRAHALARDAVWSTWDYGKAAATLSDRGEKILIAPSAARDRAEFLKRPDLGRRLAESLIDLPADLLSASPDDISFVVSDGLSAKAIDTHFVPFWDCFAPLARRRSFDWNGLVLAPYGRVAIADEVGNQRQSQLSIIFIGERPGLSANDSMGIYLTYAPEVGKTDERRNCISNIRPPAGLSYERAADKLLYLMEESLRLKVSGVDLKEDAPESIASKTESDYFPKTRENS